MEPSEHELPLRDPRSILHELDYWVGVNEEMGALCAIPPRIADRIVEIPVAMLELALGRDPQEVASKVHDATMAALREIAELDGKVGAVTELVGGRLIALRREAGLEE